MTDTGGKRNSRPTSRTRELRKYSMAIVTTNQTGSHICTPPHRLFIVLETGAKDPPEVKIVFTICQDTICHSPDNAVCFHVELLNF